MSDKELKLVQSASPFLITLLLLGGPQLGQAQDAFLVKDINPGAGDSSPGALSNLNDMFLFRPDDGTTGFELWTTDGTTSGTLLVKDINPGPGRSAIIQSRRQRHGHR